MKKLKIIGISFLTTGILFLLLAIVFFTEYQMWLEHEKQWLDDCLAKHPRFGCAINTQLNGNIVFAQFYGSIGIILAGIGITLLVISHKKHDKV